MYMHICTHTCITKAEYVYMMMIQYVCVYVQLCVCVCVRLNKQLRICPSQLVWYMKLVHPLACALNGCAHVQYTAALHTQYW